MKRIEVAGAGILLLRFPAAAAQGRICGELLKYR